MIPHRCPVCNGTGLVSRPPYVAGDQETWVASEAGPYPCRACGGTGLVWEPTEPGAPTVTRGADGPAADQSAGTPPATIPPDFR